MADDLVTVYQFRMWDMAADCYRTSRRWGTAEAIEAIKSAEIVRATAREIPASAVVSDIDGLTERGFDPDAVRGGFQTQVR